jgi:hypothetical protein
VRKPFKKLVNDPFCFVLVAIAAPSDLVKHCSVEQLKDQVNLVVLVQNFN